MSRKKPMTREQWKRWRDKVNEVPKQKRTSSSTPMFDPVPPGSIRIVQGGAPGMGKRHGKRS